MKEKLVTFRHMRNAWYDLAFPKEEAEEMFISATLDSGYIPMRLEHTKHHEGIGYVISAICGYAGKKQARILYEKHREIIGNPGENIIFPSNFPKETN